jgi:hypothetical protein
VPLLGDLPDASKGPYSNWARDRGAKDVEDFMRRELRGLITGLLIVVLLGDIGLAQKALTWQEVRGKF